MTKRQKAMKLLKPYAKYHLKYCDRIKRGYSLKVMWYWLMDTEGVVTQEVKDKIAGQLARLASRTTVTYDGRVRYHFYERREVS